MDKHLFTDSSHAQRYAKCRPKVPSAVAEIVINYMKGQSHDNQKGQFHDNQKSTQTASKGNFIHT